MPVSRLSAEPRAADPALLYRAQAAFEKAPALSSAQRTLAAEVAAAGAGQGLDVVFYGDSLVERLRGTHGGTPVAGTRDVWERHIGSRYRAAALGLAGDRTHHLMWRLSNGELPSKAPKVAALVIGVNDLTSVYLANVTGGEPAMLAEVPAVVAR